MKIDIDDISKNDKYLDLKTNTGTIVSTVRGIMETRYFRTNVNTLFYNIMIKDINNAFSLFRLVRKADFFPFYHRYFEFAAEFYCIVGYDDLSLSEARMLQMTKWK